MKQYLAWQILSNQLVLFGAVLYSAFLLSPSSSLKEKETINSVFDLVLSCERNRWEFALVIRNSMGNDIWSIYNYKYFKCNVA